LAAQFAGGVEEPVAVESTNAEAKTAMGVA